MDELRTRAAWTPSLAAVPPSLTWSRIQPHGPSPLYAGFWQRFVASCIDWILLGIGNAILSFVLSTTLDPILYAAASDLADALDLASWSVLAGWFAASLAPYVATSWLYHAGLESSSWQATLGKRALGITVTDLSGNRISFGRATGRHFAHLLSDIYLGIGYLIQPFTKKRQTLHDLIAGTLVVRT